MLLGWVWASRTALMAFREDSKATMFFGSLFFPILGDFGSKMGVQKPSFLASLDGSQAQKLGWGSEQVHNSHSGGILEGLKSRKP